MKIERLGVDDADRARELFLLMALVFGEEATSLSDDYVQRLLVDESFWALAAIEGDTVIGGVTAHVLPMTRREGSELFIYDLAVPEPRRRHGVARALITELQSEAERSGIDTMFVAAETDDDEALSFYRSTHPEETATAFFVWSPEA